MTCILLFGNSGSGKSTLAKRLSERHRLAHLDLDTLAWLATSPPQRSSLVDVKNKLDEFTQMNEDWVIEGCYTDLLQLLSDKASEIIYLDVPVAECRANAEHRPWEPHKYDSKEAQDANLAMLLDWISAYESRTDTFSSHAHQTFYQGFGGQKRRLTSNEMSQAFAGQFSASVGQ